MKPLWLFVSLPASLFAQGPLAPPGPPAPTQKSLQEIWDKIGGLESTLAAQQQQITLLQQQNSILLESAGVPVPWRLMTVALHGEAGLQALAYSREGKPAIAYYDPTGGDLKYAAYDGTSWQVTPVDVTDNVGKSASLAFSPAGAPAIAYYDVTHADLKYATRSGGTWSAVTVDSAGTVGSTCSLAFSPAGQPAIAYYDDSDGDIKHASFNGSTWQIVQVTTVTSDECEPSLAYSPSGQAGIAYQDGDLESIKLARLEGGTWEVETVDSRPVDGDQEYANPSLAFSPTGQAAVAYDHYSGTGILRVAIEDEGWIIDDAELAADWGFKPSLAFSPLGIPSVSYSYDPFGDTGPLGFGQKHGEDWDNVDVGPLGNSAAASSLRFSPGGIAGIAYQHAPTGELRFAFRSAFTAP